MLSLSSLCQCQCLLIRTAQQKSRKNLFTQTTAQRESFLRDRNRVKEYNEIELALNFHENLLQYEKCEENKIETLLRQVNLRLSRCGERSERERNKKRLS